MLYENRSILIDHLLKSINNVSDVGRRWRMNRVGPRFASKLFQVKAKYWSRDSYPGLALDSLDFLLQILSDLICG